MSSKTKQDSNKRAHAADKSPDQPAAKRTRTEDKDVAAGDEPSPGSNTASEGDAQQDLIDKSHRDYFNPVLVRRLNTIAKYANPTTSAYSLHSLPLGQLQWGKEGYGRSDKSEYMTIRDRPVVVWVLAEVAIPAFFKHGDPRPKPGVLVKPLLQSDAVKASSIIDKLSRPPTIPPGDRDGIWVTRWAASRGVSAKDVPVFDEVYDAVDMLRAKKYMPKMRALQVKEHDIVVAECTIVRWSSAGTDNGHVEGEGGQPVDGDDGKQSQSSKYRKRVWENWKVEFRLESLWYIYPGSQHSVVDAAGLDDDAEL